MRWSSCPGDLRPLHHLPGTQLRPRHAEGSPGQSTWWQGMRASPRLEGGGGPLRLCLRRVIVGGAGGVGANVAVAAGVRLALVVVGVATGSGFDRPGHALQGAPLGGIRYLRPVRRRGWSASLWPVSTAHVAHDAPSEIAGWSSWSSPAHAFARGGCGAELDTRTPAHHRSAMTAHPTPRTM